MKFPRVRFTLLRLMAAVAAMAVFFGIWVRREHFLPGCELRSSLWRAGTVSSGSGNDLWIEYGAVSLRPVATYRDYDGDGFVDECLTFSGPVVAVYRASNNDGALDTVWSIDEPLRRAERLPRDSPEAGPITRAILDERVRAHPFGVRPGRP